MMVAPGRTACGRGGNARVVTAAPGPGTISTCPLSQGGFWLAGFLGHPRGLVMEVAV